MLELIKIRRILIYNAEGTILGDDATFIINENSDDVEKDANGKELYSIESDAAEQIEMNFEQENNRKETDE